VAILGQLDGAAFRLAALASERFPYGEALDAYLDGEAGLADFLRCGEPGCLWGVEPGSYYCRSHGAERTAASKRAYKARKGDAEPSPDCCGDPPPWPRKVKVGQDDPRQADARGYEGTAHELARGRWHVRPLGMLGAPSKPTGKRCGQHKDAHDTGRGYETVWRSGARGDHRVAWLYGILGQDGSGTWGRGWDAAGPLPATDRGPDEGRSSWYVDLPCPHLWADKGALDWFAGHPGWVNHPLPETAPWTPQARWVSASQLRPELDRLSEIHRIRHVNGYWPWGENVRVLVERARGG
jgi:hypothetical protein